jgi:DNA-binding NarL/FixJ family response regulator
VPPEERRDSHEPGTATIRIVLVDDHAVFRQGIRAMLEKDRSMQVVAEAGSGQEAVRLAQEHKPDIVLMDISMPDMNGLDATRAIRSQLPGTRVLGLSMHLDGKIAADLIRAGASGYLAKICDSGELCNAIRRIMSNQIYMSQDMVGLVAAACSRGDEEADGLTPRQQEILLLYAQGHSTKEIAASVNRSIKTVEMHRQNIMKRLNLRSLADLTRYAIRKGLISSDA